MSLDEQFFFLSPVQAVKVTEENLEEVAAWCGGRVFETTSTAPKTKGQQVKAVWVPTPASAKSSNAFPGMYITRRCVMTNQREIKVTWAVFVARYFEMNYFETPNEAIDKTWAKKDKKAAPKKERPAPTINVYVDNTASREEIANVVAAAAESGQVMIARDASL